MILYSALHYSKHNSIRGFTLVELVVVIVIMAILAAIAVPSFHRMIVKQELNRSARELAATFTQARSQAMILRTDVVVTLNATTPNTSTHFYWQPYGRAILSSTATTATFSGSTGGITAQTDFKICDSSAEYARTVTILILGTVRQTEGSC